MTVIGTAIASEAPSGAIASGPEAKSMDSNSSLGVTVIFPDMTEEQQVNALVLAYLRDREAALGLNESRGPIVAVESIGASNGDTIDQSGSVIPGLGFMQVAVLVRRLDGDETRLTGVGFQVDDRTPRPLVDDKYTLLNGRTPEQQHQVGEAALTFLGAMAQTTGSGRRPTRRQHVDVGQPWITW